jgi:hypothetical protein
MLRIENERNIQRPPLEIGRLFLMQQVQEMAGDGALVAPRFNALPGGGEMMPVHQHRRERREQSLGDGVLLRFPITLLFETAEHRCSGAQYVHRMRIARKHLERLLQRLRQVALAGDALAKGIELGLRRQVLVEQKVRDLAIARLLGQVLDVVAAVVQPFAFAPDGADGGLARGDAGEDNVFLSFSHVQSFPFSRVCREKSWSSFSSYA